MIINKCKKMVALMLVVSAICMCSACGDRVVLTTGLGTNEVFRVGSERATSTELLLYLTNIANQYDRVYGEALWTMEAGEDCTMLDNCKDIALAQLSQVKAMKLLAKEHEITLTTEEEESVAAAALLYFESLSAEEKAALGVEKVETIEQLYGEKLLADKLYVYLIRDVNPEISDDEARIITVQHILLKTYTTDEHGNRKELSDAEAGKLYQLAEEIRQKALDGESFDALISKYSEDSKSSYSFGKGDMEESFEEAAFALATDEISSIVRTSHGYHIMKCISTLDREETDLNKEKLLLSRKQAVFGDTYNQFVAGLEKQTNVELLQNMSLPDSTVVDTAELFTIYEEQLGKLYTF